MHVSRRVQPSLTVVMPLSLKYWVPLGLFNDCGLDSCFFLLGWDTFLILIEEPKLLLQLKLSFTASLSGTKTWASSVLFSFYVNAGHKPWIFGFPLLSTSTRLQLGLFFPTCSITAFPTSAMFHAWYSLADTGTSGTLAFLGFARSLTPRFEITSTSAPLHFTCFFLVGGCFIRIICFYGERSDKCVSAWLIW